MIGESWLGRLASLRRPSRSVSTMAHPEPNTPAAALLKSALSASNEPKSRAIAVPASPVGSPPLPPITCQNMVWLAWPPALLRTTVRIASGRVGTCSRRVGKGVSCRSGWSLRAAFRLFT